MSISLRDYQIEAVKSVIDGTEAGINRQLTVSYEKLYM